MSDFKKIMLTVLFFGGIWGINEATLGHLLHFLPTGISGTVMFPIGFYLMFNAYKATGKQQAIFYTALIAAGIKCTDAFLPGTSVANVANPAVSIVLESLVVFAFVRFYNNKKVFSKSFAMSLGWIFLFVAAQALVLKPAAGLYLMPVVKMLAFIAINTAINGLLIGGYLKHSAVLDWRLNFRRLSYAQSAVIIALAIALEIWNSLIAI